MKNIQTFEEFLNESLNEGSDVKKEYEALKKASINWLRQEWSRNQKVGDPKELDKNGLISDLLRWKFGNKRVAQTFGLDEGSMPDKFIGNDDIVYLKTKEDSKGANYNLYYKGHDIDTGGYRFSSEKELKDFAANYILSNQWYNKLKWEKEKPLPKF